MVLSTVGYTSGIILPQEYNSSAAVNQVKWN